ncbi:MAG: metallophosphoesterase [Planctomycetales bacterium]|nr:metallophosphoesterase [Planctomycetales bacterium]MCA9228492.1 metallophosphoesterase [Planctomycetales bacterium]
MANRPHIRIIGDVHGRIAARPKRKERNVRDLFPRSPYSTRADRDRGRNYLQLIARSTYSIQVGDLGLDYDHLCDVDPAFHRVIAGNHDNLTNLTSHFLGDFGVHSIPLQSGSFDFFFIRGAQSLHIDRLTAGVNWWPDEELTETQVNAAMAHYDSVRPRLVISHDCPTEIVSLVASIAVTSEPSRSNSLLQSCFDMHAPSMWIFGHHHRNWSFHHQSGTNFVCVGQLAYFDFDDLGLPMFGVPR